MRTISVPRTLLAIENPAVAVLAFYKVPDHTWLVSQSRRECVEERIVLRYNVWISQLPLEIKHGHYPSRSLSTVRCRARVY